MPQCDEGSKNSVDGRSTLPAMGSWRPSTVAGGRSVACEAIQDSVGAFKTRDPGRGCIGGDRTGRERRRRHRRAHRHACCRIGRAERGPRHVERSRTSWSARRSRSRTRTPDVERGPGRVAHLRRDRVGHLLRRGWLLSEATIASFSGLNSAANLPNRAIKNGSSRRRQRARAAAVEGSLFAGHGRRSFLLSWRSEVERG